MAAAHAAAAPAVTAVIPPAVDAVSIQTAVSLSAHGAQHNTMAALGVEELGRSGVGVGQSGTSYATGDAAAAASYLVAGG
ncbi:PE family protein [Mycolicibacterium novocastrense]|uniref:PE family protein n=1 Tax=Mycolicibacterium novocastrense TaxID=59813 RepID=A0ABQ0KMM9_MYCNV|nr:PE family protein [Mycolicibacterium novocastrense]